MLDAQPELREPWPGEELVLAEAVAAGRRAAAWIRSLPVPPGETWIVGPLADAVEITMSSLDPGDCDDIDREGSAGVPEGVAETLRGLIFCVGPVSPWLAPEQQVALLAVVHCVSGIPRLLANDPGTVLARDLPALCAVIDFACMSARTD